MRFVSSFVALAVAVFSGAAFAGMVDYFTDNGYGNPVSTIQHPRAEHYHGVTYITYQGPHEDPYVCAYDHAAGKWSGPVRAGINPMGKTPDPMDAEAVDNHGRPAMIVDGKGYIHLVFGGHGGYVKFGWNTHGTWGKGKQTHVVSKKPADIASWELLDNISPFGTYSQFVKMDDGDIYLFYRHGSHRSDWVYQKSTDDCRAFSPPVSMLKHKVQEYDRNVHDAWYAWFDQGKGDTITASYIYHPCRVKGHTKERYNGYYMKMNCVDESWENVRGELLTLPVTKEHADASTLVCDTGKERSNRGTCRVDAEGNPHVFFRQGPGQVRYYRWLGNAWQDPVVVTRDSKRQDGDMIVESPKVIRMLLCLSHSGVGEVCWWQSRDGGLSWEKETCLISSPNARYDASTLVRNAHPDGRMVVSEDGRGQHHLYRKLYLLGDSGPVGRPEEEARSLGDLLENLAVAGAAPRQDKAKKRLGRHITEDGDEDE